MAGHRPAQHQQTRRRNNQSKVSQAVVVCFLRRRCTFAQQQRLPTTLTINAAIIVFGLGIEHLTRTVERPLVSPTSQA